MDLSNRHSSGISALGRGRSSRHESAVSIRKKAKNERMDLRRRLEAPTTPMETRTEGLSEKTERDLLLLGQMCLLVNSDVESRVLDGLLMLKALVSSSRKPPINEVIVSGVLPRVAELMDHSDLEIKRPAGWILTNVLSGTTHHTMYALGLGVIGKFLGFLTCSDIDLVHDGMWALGNIAGESCELRDELLKMGILPLLLNWLSYGAENLMRTGSWLLSNLMRGNSPVIDSYYVGGMLVGLKMCYEFRDTETTCESNHGLRDLLMNGYEKEVMAQGLVEKYVLVQLESAHDDERHLALNILGVVIESPTDYSSRLLRQSNGMLVPHLVSMLYSRSGFIVRESAWTISNLVTTSEEIALHCLNTAGLLRRVIDLLGDEKELIRREASYCITNCCDYNSRAIGSILVGEKTWEGMFGLVKRGNGDLGMLSGVLTYVEFMLKYEGNLGYDFEGMLEMLMEVRGGGISDRASELEEKYLNGE